MPDYKNKLDFKILSFIDSSNELFLRNERGRYEYKDGMSLSKDTLLNSNSYKIHKVRRLKDRRTLIINEYF